MNVKELKPKAAVDEITLKIDSIDEPRTVRNGSLTVANATASDETGQVTITLWNDDINRIKVGDSIKITKGWVGEYQGQLQLSAGKFGKLEVVGATDGAKKASSKKSADVDIDEEII